MLAGFLAIVVATAGWMYVASRTTVQRKDGVSAVVVGRHFGPGGESAVGAFATVELVGGTCLGLALGTGRAAISHVIAVWPHGTSLLSTGGAVRVRVPGHGTLGVGDRILFGPGDRKNLSGQHLPHACRGVDGLVVRDPRRN